MKLNEDKCHLIIFGASKEKVIFTLEKCRYKIVMIKSYWESPLIRNYVLETRPNTL